MNNRIDNRIDNRMVSETALGTSHNKSFNTAKAKKQRNSTSHSGREKSAPKRPATTKRPTAPRRVTAARLAREQAGLSLEEAARRAHCTVAYLRRLELQGGVPWIMGMRLAHIYGCNCQVFLYK